MSNQNHTEALPPHPSHATVRDWMPVSEALRLADLWTVGDLDNSGQWRAAIKVLADEVRAALAQRQQVPASRLVSELVKCACRQERDPSEKNQAEYMEARRAVEAALTAAPQAAQEQKP